MSDPLPHFMIMVTGSRSLKQEHIEWVDEAIMDAMDANPAEEYSLIVGDCKTGADKFATDLAIALNLDLHIFEANWQEEGPAAGPRRNMRMANVNPDICLAFVQKGVANKGTLGAARICEKRDVYVEVHECE